MARLASSSRTRSYDDTSRAPEERREDLARGPAVDERTDERLRDRRRSRRTRARRPTPRASAPPRTSSRRRAPCACRAAPTYARRGHPPRARRARSTSAAPCRRGPRRRRRASPPAPASMARTRLSRPCESSPPRTRAAARMSPCCPTLPSVSFMAWASAWTSGGCASPARTMHAPACASRSRATARTHADGAGRHGRLGSAPERRDLGEQVRRDPCDLTTLHRQSLVGRHSRDRQARLDDVEAAHRRRPGPPIRRRDAHARVQACGVRTPREEVRVERQRRRRRARSRTAAPRRAERELRPRPRVATRDGRIEVDDDVASSAGALHEVHEVRGARRLEQHVGLLSRRGRSGDRRGEARPRSSGMPAR